MTATLTSQEIDQLIEDNDIAGLDALAERNGMTGSRKNLSHAALWHNIQLPQFARIASIVWGGQVAVLPNTEVYKTAQVLSKKAKGKATISVQESDAGAGRTTYQITAGSFETIITLG